MPRGDIHSNRGASCHWHSVKECWPNQTRDIRQFSLVLVWYLWCDREDPHQQLLGAAPSDRILVLVCPTRALVTLWDSRWALQRLKHQKITNPATRQARTPDAALSVCGQQVGLQTIPAYSEIAENEPPDRLVDAAPSVNASRDPRGVESHLNLNIWVARAEAYDQKRNPYLCKVSRTIDILLYFSFWVVLPQLAHGCTKYDPKTLRNVSTVQRLISSLNPSSSALLLHRHEQSAAMACGILQISKTKQPLGDTFSLREVAHSEAAREVCYFPSAVKRAISRHGDRVSSFRSREHRLHSRIKASVALWLFLSDTEDSLLCP